MTVALNKEPTVSVSKPPSPSRKPRLLRAKDHSGLTRASASACAPFLRGQGQTISRVCLSSSRDSRGISSARAYAHYPGGAGGCLTT
jgi:hypothetical protein